MRGPVAVVAALATATGVVVVASGGGASADLLPTPTLSPLPTISVPLPTDSPLPLPSTTLTDGVGDPVDGVTGPLPGGDGGGSGGDGGSGSGSTDAASGTGPTSATGTGDAAGSDDAAGSGASVADRDAMTARQRRTADATPVVAGTAAARDLIDDESSPAMRAAGRQFLRADEAIAEIARQKRLIAELKQAAVAAAAAYQDLDAELTTSQAVAEALHGRWDELRHELVTEARRSYQTGLPTTDDGTAGQLGDSAGRLRDAATRADLRVGWVMVDREQVRARFQAIADRYDALEDQVRRSQQHVDELAAQRAGAVTAIQVAKGSDVALNQARIAESGALGAQIRAASARLERSGRTIRGTGDFGQPAGGVITSPYGMRYHPILHYRKLHTGTDFSGGGSEIRAADDGRVLMTVVSEAYGNVTVVDHGVIGGHRVTTAYAHQSRFLVRPGDQVRRGQPIGVIGMTGYTTGPHLHFEVREDGTTVDPMTWLAR